MSNLARVVEVNGAAKDEVRIEAVTDHLKSSRVTDIYSLILLKHPYRTYPTR